MARRKRNRKPANTSLTVKKAWYENRVEGQPKGYIRYTNPQKKKLSCMV